MNALLGGGGGREHAIAWKLRQSPRVTDLFVAPGNAGTAGIAVNLLVKVNDLEGIVRAARQHHIDLVVVGPEDPLALGLVDRLAADEAVQIFDRLVGDGLRGDAGRTVVSEEPLSGREVSVFAFTDGRTVVPM